MRTVDIIERKRDGAELSREEIEHLVMGYVRGDVPDYQVSAWLMAVCCRGMSQRETFDLTAVMASSGETLDLSGVGWPVADKHSSGGVGDKTTLIVAPLVRARGVAVAKMSGRGLGFTGGTLDKLESIPGFRVDMRPTQFLQQLSREGIVVSGQTPDLAPADRLLYALRDVTGTVASVPLIASSIMSKKLAVGAGALVLDVKVGSGALMTGLAEARELARLMVEIGAAAGKRISALLSSMDQPLGCAVGNALEVVEAIQTLRGEGPADLVELSTLLAGEMLFLADAAESLEAGQRLALEALASGRALEVFERWVEAQGGDPRIVGSPGLIDQAPFREIVESPRAGWVQGVDARKIAAASLLLGAGRARKGDPIDRRVGVVLRAKGGAEVQKGQPLAEIHAADAAVARKAAADVLEAFTLGAAPAVPVATVLERLGPDGL